MVEIMEIILEVFLLFSFFSSTVKGQAQGTVRLNNSRDTSVGNREGDVQIYYEGDWNYICYDDGANDDFAYVVCHQLGYTGGESSESSNQPDEFGFYDMSCKKDYLVILQCSFKTDAYCDSSSSAYVTCYISRIWDRAPYNGMVRLVNGSYTGEGVVEVYCHGKWGVVCSDSEDSYYSDSDNFELTVCNQLGYNSLSDHDYDTEFSNSFFLSMQNTDCGDSNAEDIKKCVTDCASCDDSIYSCDGILHVTCIYTYDKSITSNHGGKMGACSPTNLHSGQLAVTALVLILTLYLYLITRVCIRCITICCCNEDNDDNKCSIICDILCCNQTTT